jgi:hypothetical protein
MNDQQARDLLRKELCRGWELETGSPPQQPPPDEAINQVLATFREWKIPEELYAETAHELVHHTRIHVRGTTGPN